MTTYTLRVRVYMLERVRRRAISNIVTAFEGTAMGVEPAPGRQADDDESVTNQPRRRSQGRAVFASVRPAQTAHTAHTHRQTGSPLHPAPTKQRGKKSNHARPLPPPLLPPLLSLLWSSSSIALLPIATSIEKTFHFLHRTPPHYCATPKEHRKQRIARDRKSVV